MLFHKKQLSLATSTVLAAGLYITGSAVANADVVYDNLAATTGGADSVANNGPLAASFSTGATDFTVNDVKLLLAGNPTTTGNIQVNIYSDTGTYPNLFVATVGGLYDSNLAPTSSLTSASVYDFNLGSGFTLTANTRYWLGVIPDAAYATSIAWAWATDTSGTGAANEYYLYQGTVGSNNTGGPYQFSISGTPVPAPAAVWLFGSALTGFVGFARRKQA